MRTNITIGVILLALSLRGYFCAISERFREVQDAKGKEFPMTVMKEVSVTIEECALLCMLAKTCLSFFHDKADGTCHLITGTVLESQMTPAVPSRPLMSYFISDLEPDDSDGSFCPMDFDKTSLPGLCFKKIENAVDNDAARTLCEAYSSGNMVGHLLTVYTLEMYTQLDTILSSGNYHIDGYKRLPDGSWVDWKGDELAVVRWDSGEPDNAYNNHDPTMEQCVFTRSYGKVHDGPCSGYFLKILCQLEYVKRN